MKAKASALTATLLVSLGMPSAVSWALKKHIPIKVSSSEDMARPKSEWTGKESTLKSPQTCAVAVMQHMRKMTISIELAEVPLKTLLGTQKIKREVPVTGALKLNPTPKSKEKVESLARRLTALKSSIKHLSGRKTEGFATSNIAAQNHCQTNLLLGRTPETGLLDTLNQELNVIQAEINQLRDDGHIVAPSTANVDNSFEPLFAPIQEAKNDVQSLGSVLTQTNRKLLGLSKAPSTHQKINDSLYQKLQESISNSKDPQEANLMIYEFIRNNDIGYGDAAKILELKILKDVKSRTTANTEFLQDFLIDRPTP